MNKSDLDNIKKNIEAAKEVNMDRITLSLTLEEAEQLISLFIKAIPEGDRISDAVSSPIVGTHPHRG